MIIIGGTTVTRKGHPILQMLELGLLGNLRRSSTELYAPRYGIVEFRIAQSLSISSKTVSANAEVSDLDCLYGMIVGVWQGRLRRNDWVLSWRPFCATSPENSRAPHAQPGGYTIHE
jgi:hypothetical protein